MGFWSRLFKPKVEDYSISSRYRFLMGPTAAGKTVNERSAMLYMPACVFWQKVLQGCRCICINAAKMAAGKRR